MQTQQLSGTTALVTGASRGFDRAIALALSEAGASVVGVARDQAQLEELRKRLGDSFTPVVANASDPVAAGQLIDRYRPRTLVLNARASPLARPLQHHTWQTFSRNWEVDVQQVFHWTREALLRPLDPGAHNVYPKQIEVQKHLHAAQPRRDSRPCGSRRNGDGVWVRGFSKAGDVQAIELVHEVEWRKQRDGG